MTSRYWPHHFFPLWCGGGYFQNRLASEQAYSVLGINWLSSTFAFPRVELIILAVIQGEPIEIVIKQNGELRFVNLGKRE